MNATYYQVGELTVVEVNGRIEPDQNKPFRDVCEKKLKDQKVIFCLENLSFTGSSNLTTFFESIHLIPKASIVGLKNDFHRLLALKGFSTNLKTFKTLTEALRYSDL